MHFGGIDRHRSPHSTVNAEKDVIGTGDAVAGSDIVVLKDGVSASPHTLLSKYDGTPDGSPPDPKAAYVLDTGIRITHQEFEGRASRSADFIDGDLVSPRCT